jgi:hypothetical protein
VKLVLRVNKVLKAYKVFKVKLVPQVPRVTLEILELLAHKVKKESKVFRESKVKLDLRGPKVSRVFRERRGLLDQWEKLEPQDLGFPQEEQLGKFLLKLLAQITQLVGQTLQP